MKRFLTRCETGPITKEYLAERVLLGLHGIASFLSKVDAVVEEIGISVDPEGQEYVISIASGTRRGETITMQSRPFNRDHSIPMNLPTWVRKGTELFVNVRPLPSSAIVTFMGYFS